MTDHPSAETAQFRQTLAPGPLNAHLAAMHALYVHLGAHGDVLAVAEHHLRSLAVYTAEQPGWPPSPRGDLIRLRERVELLADSIHGDSGWEHNSGCEGEPDCFACIEADLRQMVSPPEQEKP